jgi:hypothetical protein
MMQDLRVVLDWSPEFAEAYNMLAMAEVEGGGIRTAMASMRAAIQLSPRNQGYLLNMAKIYMAGKQWDAATALLERLKASAEPAIASVASKQLSDLPTLKKYGLLPQSEAPAQPAAATTPAAQRTAPPKPGAQKQNAQVKKESEDRSPAASAEETSAVEAPAQPQIDKRPIQYAKGKLVGVDCSQAPVAVLTVAVGAKVMKLRTKDYKSLTIIGADELSCDWKSRAVEVNYKAGGKSDGDLVSVEVQ